jgi:hypothetical protein
MGRGLRVMFNGKGGGIDAIWVLMSHGY